MKRFDNSITKPSPPDEIIESGWGRITMEEWCERVATEMHGIVVLNKIGQVVVVKGEG